MASAHLLLVKSPSVNTSKMNPKTLGNKAPSTAPMAKPMATNTVIPVTKLSDGTLLKIKKYDTGVMMANRTPPNRAANSLLTILYTFFTPLNLCFLKPSVQ